MRSSLPARRAPNRAHLLTGAATICRRRPRPRVRRCETGSGDPARVAPPVTARGSLARVDAALARGAGRGSTRRRRRRAAARARRASDVERLLGLAVASRLRDEGRAAAPGRPGVITYSRKCSCRSRRCAAIAATTASSSTPRGSCARSRRTCRTSRSCLVACRVQTPAARRPCHPRRPARGPLARSPGVARRARLRVDPRLRRPLARLITAETGLLAHLNPGVMSGGAARRCARPPRRWA